MPPRSSMPVLPCVATLAAVFCAPSTHAQEAAPVDYLTLAHGAVPVSLGGDAAALRVGMEQAIAAVDGDARGFVVTPKPCGEQTRLDMVFALPASTVFESFAVPNVLETPSPSQTFSGAVEIAGSDVGPEGPFEPLAATTLSLHPERGRSTELDVTDPKPVRWVRLTLTGSLDIQRDKTFFEFSEIIGHGTQETPSLSRAFNGTWKGRGVLLELAQDGARVSGCYDRDGELTGTVGGNVLYATGRTRSAGIPSTFVLAVDADGAITGVASTNGAPFRLYTGAASPAVTTACSEQPVEALGGGSIIHGIRFDFDAATLRPESAALLDDLAAGLAAGLESGEARSVTLIGHTSSEGAEAYNDDLSRRRAEAVAAALVERGIARDQLNAKGRGELEPIADNGSETGRALNRRVEVSCR